MLLGRLRHGPESMSARDALELATRHPLDPALTAQLASDLSAVGGEVDLAGVKAQVTAGQRAFHHDEIRQTIELGGLAQEQLQCPQR